MQAITLSPKYKEMFRDREDLFYYLLYGGRAGSKSFTSSIYLANRLVNGKGNLVYCRQYMTNVQTTIIPEFLEKISLLNIGHLLKVNKDNITCLSNGNKLFFKGLETSEGTAEAGMKGIKSLSVVLIDEAQQVKEQAFDRLLGTVRDRELNLKIILCLNPTWVQSWLYQRFFKDLPDWDYSGIVENRLYVYSCYKDSIKYLSDTFIAEVQRIKELDPVKYENQYLGKWLNSADKALLTKQLLDLALIRNEVNDYDKVVVAIDPAVSTNQNSDNTRISSMPERKIITFTYYMQKKLKQHQMNGQEELKNYIMNIMQILLYMNRIKAGQMVESTLRTVLGNFVKIQSVRATKNKVIRFQPIHALYEQQLIHHKRKIYRFRISIINLFWEYQR